MISNKQITRKIQLKSDLDISFEILSLKEKMALFNLPEMLSGDPERSNRISKMWYTLTEEEKSSIWSNLHGNESVGTFSETKSKLAINQ